MSGERTLLAHKIRLLADVPIVGPDENSTLLSTATVASSLGYNPNFIESSTSAGGAIAAGATVPLGINPPTTTPYFPTTDPVHKQIGAVTVVANELRVNGVTSLRGRITNTFGGITSGAPVSPPEIAALDVVISDDLGFTYTTTFIIPILNASPIANWSFGVKPFFFPPNPARTRVNFAFFVANLQAASTLSISHSFKVEIDQ